MGLHPWFHTWKTVLSVMLRFEEFPSSPTPCQQPLCFHVAVSWCEVQLAAWKHLNDELDTVSSRSTLYCHATGCAAGICNILQFSGQCLGLRNFHLQRCNSVLLDRGATLEYLNSCERSDDDITASQIIEN